jgi:hypothetical protein
MSLGARRLHFERQVAATGTREPAPTWTGFTAASNDGVSELSPRREGAAVSTNWIDNALEGLARAPGD